MKAWPGLRFTINIGGLDEFNHTTKVTARFFFESLNTSNVNDNWRGIFDKERNMCVSISNSVHL